MAQCQILLWTKTPEFIAEDGKISAITLHLLVINYHYEF
jgi:hypothetical protein